MAPAQHEVVIVGGGLVGASLAIALDRVGVDVAMVEATPAGALPAVFDQRNLSFAEATLHALQALGVMQRLRAATGPIRRIHVSRDGDFGRVVVARDFGEALEARLGELAHLTRYRPARCTGIEAADDGVRIVRIDDGTGERRIAARLLVAADGARSGIRTALGIDAAETGFDQALFIARVRSERAPDGTAYERFGEHGPTALLPRGDGHFGVVHGVPRAEADAVAALGDDAWLARLQLAFGWRVGRFLATGPRSVHPALRVVAQRTTTTRAVLVGNAAQAVHPVGAQGFNLGLRDALTLAELVEAGRDDPGSDAVLAEYARRRADDRTRTLAFSDGLARLTANPARLLRPLRSLGLVAIDRLPTLQAWLVGGALGYRGDVPALCREATT